MNQLKKGEITSQRNWGFFTFIMFWTGLVALCSLYMTIPLLPVFEKEFAITPNQSAWAGSIFSIFFALGCVFFGIMAEKFGLKRVMVFGFISLSAMTVLVGFAGSYEQMILFRALQGIAAATFSPVALTYIGVMFPPERRGTTIGFISTGFLMAGIVGQLVSSYIQPLVDWQTVFFFFGALYLLNVLLLMRLPKDDGQNKNKDILAILKKFKEPFQHKSIVITYLISITILLSFVGMYTALGQFLAENYRFNHEQIFLVRACGGMAIILSAFTGKLAKRFGAYPVLYTGFSLSIMGLFFMGFSENLVLSILMSVIFVAGIALVVPTMLAVVGRLGGENKGIVTSLYTFILFIGASLGPIIATGIMQIGATQLPFIVFALIQFISLALTIVLYGVEHKKEKEIAKQESGTSVM